MKKVFLVKVEITSEDGGYKLNEEIIIPVLTSSAYNAERKVENRYWGSEYPGYRIKSIIKCDNGFFKPMIK